MSFFDEEEETRVRPPAPQTRRRPRAGGSGPRGGGRLPPRGTGGGTVDQGTIRTRQAVAGAALLVILILIVLGIHSCTVSAGNDALRSYSDSVDSLIIASNQNGQLFFRQLSSGTGSTNPTNLQTEINARRIAADRQLTRAENLTAPDQLKEAQVKLVWAMQLRRDGIKNIASVLPQALQTSTATNAVNTIALEMARLYASDVAYKDYSLPMIESALSNAGIAFGGANGLPVDNVQFLPSLSWLTASYVASQLHATVPASTKPAAPGIHGHELNSCSVGSSTLSTTAATTLPAGSPPTLTCSVTNDGQNTETNVVVQAKIGGTSVVGQQTIPQTQPNQQYNVQISLPTAPPNGTYQLSVTVERVPGETTVTHNTKVFPVTFG